MNVRPSAFSKAEAKYPVAVTRHIAGLIDPADANDPIARQFLPGETELLTTPEERADPIGDNRHSPVPGIVHRHADRVLFKPVMVCPVYCRFCFRREMVGPDAETLSPQAYDDAFAYIAAHPEIAEIIVTGGDPFVLSARRAGDIATRAASIPHIRKLRWHSRVPVVDPARINETFANAIRLERGQTRVAVHANHPREFTPEAREACARLKNAGIELLSQSVLLKGVNADIETLESLVRAFLETGVRPYYLHHPDLAPGTSHFRVTVEEGRALVRALHARISPAPDYMLDIPGGYAKVSLLSENVQARGGGKWRVRDPAGRWHIYPPE